MSFTLIDKQNWQRKEYFDHYMQSVPCTYSMTIDLDISIILKRIKLQKISLYPVMIYAFSRIANSHKEFQMSINQKGQLGFYDKINPSYTIFHKNTETFSEIWTEYNEDFSEFYKAYLNDMQQFSHIEKMTAKPSNENNLFNISCIPWATFTSFNLNLEKGYLYLSPIFTIGKYRIVNKKTILPLAIQVHHSVCDGYHLARFCNELQELLNTFVL